MLPNYQFGYQQWNTPFHEVSLKMVQNYFYDVHLFSLKIPFRQNSTPFYHKMFVLSMVEESGFRHLITYQRAISNKAMPSKNSPSNVPGKTADTMLFEYIVVCEKVI